MYAIGAPVPVLPPATSTGPGPDRTDHATTSRGTEPVRAAETARPPAAPEPREQTVADLVARPRVADSALPEMTARSVLSARDAMTPASEDAAPERAPDPMIPPVPMRYLSELIKPAEDRVAPPDPTDDRSANAVVLRVGDASRLAEAGSSLDVLR